MQKPDSLDLLLKMQDPLPSTYTTPDIVAQHMAWRLVEAMCMAQPDTWPPQTEAEVLRLADLIAQTSRRIASAFEVEIEGDEFPGTGDEDSEDES